MKTLESLQRKISTADDLQSIVKMMKSLAVVNIHQYEDAVLSLADHSQVLAMAMQVLMINLPGVLSTQKPGVPQCLGIVIFGSDQGMCGRFNPQLVEFMNRRLERLYRFQARSEAELKSPTFLAVGSRVGDSLTAAGYEVNQCLSVPCSLGGITPLIQQIVLQLESWRQKSQVDHIWVFHNRPTGGMMSSPTLLQLFPLSYLYLKQLEQKPWPARCRPQVMMDYERLFTAIFQQHFFSGLYRACAESLASENASRLAAMQVAEKNIDERLQTLRVAYQQQRQDAITEELLDIVSGFEALDP
ncbi:alternate f1f0 f1 subunit gamma [Leptolyngbya sp. Heron Island J]|uniref:F0F1 ATP synthase subunit gamma n=1 Tax=Leptolyngbya sp. Heron Island J TaxID=1385935 RepID=UPI0003B982D1|nr:F0F1 ATP synthase subunit gamma [Leptolyngbya sp. Heron Island J]ESA37436.1 alternate f1f0 f1 subunit gamma [Leptolyngbya sp. Heron Island J]